MIPLLIIDRKRPHGGCGHQLLTAWGMPPSAARKIHLALATAAARPQPRMAIKAAVLLGREAPIRAKAPAGVRLEGGSPGARERWKTRSRENCLCKSLHG